MSDLTAYSQFKSSFLKNNCTRCALSEGRSHLVFDRGNPASKILVIGEAPGAEEDKRGQCFVGRAGKVLDSVMADIGLDTNQDMLIINIVKCRPPKNRPPRDEEASECSPFLEKQIRLVNPEIILLLGRTALKHVMPALADEPMDEHVGKIITGTFFKEKKEILCMLLYHPAYLLYNPKKRQDMRSHLENLRKIMKLFNKAASFFLVIFLLSSFIMDHEAIAAVSAATEQQRIKVSEQRQESTVRIESSKNKAAIEVADQNRDAKPAQRPAESAPPTEEDVFQIDHIQFTGNTVIASEEIQKIVSPFQGKQMTLAEVKQIALSITQLYQSKGYITCRAYLPPQKMSDKLLKIQIFEGKLGAVQVQGNRYFSTQQIKKYVAKLIGKVLQYSELAKNIQRNNLHPDHEVRAVIVPGKSVGTSDLILDVKDRLPLHIGGEINNFGTKLTGKERYSVSLRNTNLLGVDDIFAARAQFGEEVFAIGTQYAVPVGEYDTRVGATFNYTDVSIGGPFKILDLGGTALSYSAFLNQPVLDNGWLGLTWTNSFESKSIKNTILGIISSKDELRMVKTGLNVDETDKYGRTFITNDLTFGTSWFRASDKHDPLLSRADAGAGFFKYSASVNRINPIKDSTYFLIKGAGQISPDRLVSAEQFDMDGAYGVRGYPQSDYLGDNGINATAELRVPFYFIPREAKVPWTNQTLWNKLNFIGFVDGGYSKLKAHAVGEAGSRSDWGVGGGMRFDLPHNLVGRFEYGVPVGDTPTDRSHGQFYFSVSGDLL